MGVDVLRPSEIAEQKAPSREQVFHLEDMMRQFPQREMRLEHHFSPGVYARELHIPADTILTGMIHKYAQLNILSAGEISVLTEDGVKRVSAPFTVVSPPGTKRVAYAHTDCVWTTILATNETDPEKIEDHFTAKSEEDYQAFLDGRIWSSLKRLFYKAKEIACLS